jgi:rhodanese-related sulfurtransferase
MVAEAIVESALVVLEELVDAELLDHAARRYTSEGGRQCHDPAMAPGGRQSLAELLAEAEARIERLSPAEAAAALERGALLVDIRSDGDRERDGLVSGALHVPRTVLEWRLAPDSEWGSPHVGGLDRHVVLMCDHGCSSVLAAATLVDLGYARAGDVVGGFSAWRDAGLPVVRGASSTRDPDELPGMGPPDPP